jgi:hypothetical protein
VILAGCAAKVRHSRIAGANGCSGPRRLKSLQAGADRDVERTSPSRCRFLDDARRASARDRALLVPVDGWFTERSDTADPNDGEGIARRVGIGPYVAR